MLIAAKMMSNKHSPTSYHAPLRFVPGKQSLYSSTPAEPGRRAWTSGNYAEEFAQKLMEEAVQGAAPRGRGNLREDPCWYPMAYLVILVYWLGKVSEIFEGCGFNRSIFAFDLFGRPQNIWSLEKAASTICVDGSLPTLTRVQSTGLGSVSDLATPHIPG